MDTRRCATASTLAGLMLIGSPTVRSAAPHTEADERRAPVPARVSVLVFDRSASDRSEVVSALTTARDVFEAARITLVWIDCADVATFRLEGSPCARTPKPNEFLLRILPGTAQQGRDVSPLALGFAVLDESGRGVVATVYAGAAKRLAIEAGVDGPRVLGRVIAHELGHLLLGTARHAPRGLMRAGWDASTVRRSRAWHWQFSKREGERILHRLGQVAERRDLTAQ